MVLQLPGVLSQRHVQHLLELVSTAAGNLHLQVVP